MARRDPFLCFLSLLSILDPFTLFLCAQWLGSCETREEALYKAHTQGAITLSAIARELGLSVSRVSRLIARAEQA